MKKHVFLLTLATIFALLFMSCGGETVEEPVEDAADTAVDESTESEMAEEPAVEEEAAESVTLTYLVDDSEANQASAKALADAYMGYIQT